MKNTFVISNKIYNNFKYTTKNEVIIKGIILETLMIETKTKKGIGIIYISCFLKCSFVFVSLEDIIKMLPFCSET